MSARSPSEYTALGRTWSARMPPPGREGRRPAFGRIAREVPEGIATYTPAMASSRLERTRDPRRPSRAALALAAAVLISSSGAGCRKADQQPVKVDQGASAQRARAERTSPFKNPKRDPPGPREPAQLEGEALESNIAEARRLLASGDSIRAMHLLYKCANRNPPSVRCDGELGMLLLENRTRKAHADYFAAEAVRLDEPEADRDFYRRLAEMAASRGRFTVAIDALQRIIARGEAEAEDYVALSHALQSDSKRLHEAIAALETAYGLKPEEHAWLHEQAVLMAQTTDKQAAIELFERYKEAVKDDAAQVAIAEERLAALRATQRSTHE